MGHCFTIASASIKENIDFFVSIFRLDELLDPDSIIYDDGSYVDKVAMFSDASAMLGIDKTKCLIFEDSKSGVNDAIKAGFDAIILMYEHHQDSSLSQLKEVIFHASDYDAVKNYLKVE